VVHEPLLHRHREEFSATVSLDPLHRKWHFFDDTLQEDQRTGCGASREHGQYAIACAVIHGGVLIKARGNLARVELDAVPRNQSGIPVSCLPSSRANQWRHVIGDQDLVHGVEREAEIVMAPQFVLDPASP
jgi:hypothetical protein